VLIMSWLKLLKGYPLSLLPTILVLILPGYALITAIWPSDEKMRWTIRAGLGFVLGVFFILFLPLIFSSLKWSAFTGNLNQILLILTILFSLVAMVRRRVPKDEMEPLRKDAQLTLEESIERATLMRQKAEAKPDEYEDHYEGYEEYIEDEYYKEDTAGEEFYHEDLGKETYEEPEEEGIKEEIEEEEREIEPQKYPDLKKEKPLQYERIKDRYHLDEDEHPPSGDKHVPEDHEYAHDGEDHPSSEQPKGVPLRVEKPVKTSTTDYEAEMDKPVWADEPSPKKFGFRNWDLVMILFLSGISLLFLYFNPLKTTATSIVFFILLLLILGYAGLTIVFPDKSRVSSRNLILTSVIIAIILFILSFLAWNMHLLPSMPKYIVQIMFVASVILSAGAFIRKWRTIHDIETSVEDHEESFEEKEEKIEPLGKPQKTEEPHRVEEVVKTEETPEEEPDKSEELTPSQSAKEETLRKLQTIGTSINRDKEVTGGPAPKTPSEDDKSHQGLLSGSKWEKTFSIILIISLILAISATIYIIVNPKQGEKFTEFYILGPNGTASNYPTNLTTGQNGSMIIGVVNHEYTTTDYLLVVKVNNTILKNQTLTLTNGQKVEIPYTFTAGSTGQKKLEFLLYKLPDNGTAYRSLHLWLNVK
ncbi:MAG: DUF1616 domain-containing protein, partial [Methanobacterium sp.]